jgi:hypothetical protein
MRDPAPGGDCREVQPGAGEGMREAETFAILPTPADRGDYAR